MDTPPHTDEEGIRLSVRSTATCTCPACEWGGNPALCHLHLISSPAPNKAASLPCVPSRLRVTVVPGVLEFDGRVGSVCIRGISPVQLTLPSDIEGFVWTRWRRCLLEECYLLEKLFIVEKWRNVNKYHYKPS
jgi:hypothetical protein